MTKPGSEEPSAEESGAVTEVQLRVGEVSFARQLLVALILLLVSLLFLLGLLFVARGSPVHGVFVEGERDLPPAADDPLFARAMQLHAGARLEGNNHIQLLQNGDGTFPRMWDDLRSASRSITVQMYYFTPGALADTLSAHLRERARAGVRVLLLLDAFGARSLRRGYLDALREAGVAIAYLRPLVWYRLDRLSHRSHVRSVIVDGRIGYTGGFGFGDFWLGNARTPGEWRETNVRMQGPVVLQLQAAFMAGWAEATGELLTGELYFPAEASSSDNLTAALMYFAPTVGSAEAERFLALTIASARRTLYVANSYFIPDAQFREMLIAAAKRGVDVRILVAGEHTDVKTTWHAARARYEELLADGVRIYEYGLTMMHSKTIVMDGLWSTIGSLNFDNRSLSYNDEANVVVLDTRFGAEMHAIFLRDLAASKEILLDDFRTRSFWNRLMESASNLISGLL